MAYDIGRPSRDETYLYARTQEQRNSLSVADVELLSFHAAIIDDDPAVGQNTIDIEKK
jgi:hypothetical protein